MNTNLKLWIANTGTVFQQNLIIELESTECLYPQRREVWKVGTGQNGRVLKGKFSGFIRNELVQST